MQVEDVAGIGLAARRPAQQQRELAVGVGLLGEVVVDHQGVPPLLVHEVLGHRRPGVGGDVLQRRRVGGRGRDHDGVVHGALLAQLLDHPDHGRLLLPHRDVDADHVAALLIDDGVEGDRGLAGPAVADDQLALAAADRDHAVDRLDPGLQRLVDRLALGDAGGLELERPAVRGLHHAEAVQRPPQGVDHPADELLAAGDAEELPGAAHLVALLDVQVLAEDDHADRALLQVEDLSELAVLELELLAGHGVAEPVDAGDAVAHLEHPPHLGQVDLGPVVLDLLGDHRRDLVHFELHSGSSRFIRLPLRRSRRGRRGSRSRRAPADARPCAAARGRWCCRSCGRRCAAPRRPAAPRPPSP